MEIKKILNNILEVLKKFVLKPIKTFNEFEGKVNTNKKSFIFLAIIMGIGNVINIVKVMYNSIFVKTFDFATFTNKNVVDFNQLKKIDYLDLIFRNFSVSVIVVLSAVAVFYVGSLIIKKTTNYVKLLNITTYTLIFAITINSIIVPLLNIIWLPIGIILGITSTIGIISLFVMLLNEEIKIENKELKLVFNTFCISFIVIIGYFVVANLITKGIAVDINNLNNLIK